MMRSFLKTVLCLVIVGLPFAAWAEEKDGIMTGKEYIEMIGDPAAHRQDAIDKIDIKVELRPVNPQPTFTGFVEAHLQLDGTNRPTPIVDMGFQRNFSKYGLGLSGFAWVQDGWAQAYIGPTYKPADWVQLGVSVGGEMGSDYKLKARYATSLWFGYDIFSFAGCVEFNNDSFRGDRSGVWYDLLLKLTPKNWVSVGWRA